MTWLWMTVYVLAVARLTRLVTTDKIGQPIRQWMLDRRGSDSAVTYLVFCSWCMSLWIGFATAPAAIALTGISWWSLPILALSASQVTGLIAARLDTE